MSAAPTTAKNIILFSDGTGNSSAKLFRTNVWRVYEAVDLADPQDPIQPRQFAFYDNGVGTSSFKPLAALGGALGVGLARNVRDLYSFLCRTYVPGDKIYGFGFSRGAFTIRVLVGLVLSQGLVPYNGDEASLRRRVNAAYREYRRKYKTLFGLVTAIRSIRDLFTRDSRYRNEARIGSPTSSQPLEIEFLGLWDTVDAYGLPIDELTRAIDLFVWPLTMRDLNLSNRVKRARHALAIDDERNTFHPRLWNEHPQPGNSHVGVPGGNEDTTHTDQERISQVWFAGAHSNVGGGYPDDSVAYVSLEWIMTEAQKFGLRFSHKIWSDYRALADENAPINDSRHGLAGYYRYSPRRIEELTNQKNVVIRRPKIHESVLRRIKIGQDGYAPFVLPPGFAVAKLDGSIISGNAYLEADIGPGSAFAKQREHAWNWVWWRRIAYFFTLFATLVLVLMPWVKPASPDGACSSRLCFASGVVDIMVAVLPGFTAKWTDSFASHPGWFLPLFAFILLGLYFGGVFASKVRDAMRLIWYAIPRTSPRAVPAPRSPGKANRVVEWLRTRPAYKGFFRLLAGWLLPLGFLCLVGFLCVSVVSQVTFAFRDSVGSICRSTGSVTAVTSAADGQGFATNALCTSTALRLEEGATYRLHVTIPAATPWADNGIPAGPHGIPPGEGSRWMSLGTPLRRHPGQPWLKPMAKIGASGSDVYALDPLPSVPNETFAGEAVGGRPETCAATPIAPTRSAADKTFTTEIVARSTGELFLYLNDAILVPPWSRSFYCNNEGYGFIKVERLPTSEPAA